MVDDRLMGWANKSWAMSSAAGPGCHDHGGKSYAELPPASHAASRSPGSSFYLRSKGGNHQPGKGIQGNENVDKLAKAALNRASCPGKLICWSDLKPKVNAFIHAVWQENWDGEEANKLHEVLPNLGEDLSKWSQVPAALQGVPDPGDTHQSRLIHTRLPSYTPHSRQSTATLPVAQGMPIRLLGWPRTRSSFRLV
ncbi:ribonuclease hi [Plakobranchus ocellatus]|uniref:Ribonuclease hi n=1 Tax=Plakobranchus ocellatus TaxID=259542 RepID=A0AAV4C4Q9_9GAST|nr:ribonuclease hi [Plakobranchus ocellatus]